MAVQAASSPVPRMGRIAFASFIGTVIEFFDFFIFGTASALIFNKIFFPSLDPLAGTLASFATFGVAFAARPLGGVIFGHFGDRLGRKTMLVLSLVFMGVGTAGVGVLPTYAQIGIWAPLLLVLSRLLQGVAIGGEWSGAVLMAVEHAPPGKRAFYGSWPQCGIPAGLVLATVAFYFVEQLPDAAMISWGWRIPFLASAVLVALGLYVRVKISESPAFQQSLEQGEQAKFPVVEVVRKAWKPILVAILSMAAANVPFYMATVFALQYGPEHVGVSRDTVLMAVCVASLIQVATIPLAAMLADRYGRRPVLLAGSVITVLEGFPLFWLIDTGSTAAITLAMVLALPVAHALTYSPLAGITEPGAGSDVASMRSTLTGAEDGYRLNGSKTFITTGDRADVIICFATVDREKGRKGITAFALDGASPGLERGKPFDKMGMHGSSTAELFFDQVPVPAAHLLGPEGDGWRVVMNSVIKSRISAAAQGVGLARAAYGRTLAALTRLHGDKIPDEAAFALATLRGELLQGRLLLYGVAREVDRAATPNAGQIGIMKQSCTDLGFSAAREAMRILGPYGDLAELGVERCLRDAKVTQIYDGTNEVQRLLIARDSTRRLEGNRS